MTLAQLNQTIRTTIKMKRIIISAIAITICIPVFAQDDVISKGIPLFQLIDRTVSYHVRLIVCDYQINIHFNNFDAFC